MKPVTFTTPPIARIGLISDTHAPDRGGALPQAIAEIFRDVDLILHAGDIGALDVLDDLSHIAPVIAVHGNDDSTEAQRDLPYQQVIYRAGQRILLCHSHHPDRTAELESRKDDAWQPKLEQRLDLARAVNASIMVYGHTHIPMTLQQAGILLINPGAMASGGLLSRQVVRSVALLHLFADQPPQVAHVSHFDLAAPERPFTPQINWEAGFSAALAQFSQSLFVPELAPLVLRFQSLIMTWYADPNAQSAFETVYQTVLPLAQQRWFGGKDAITRTELIETMEPLRHNGQIAAPFRDALFGLLDPA